MAEPIAQPNLRPSYKVTRAELLKAIEDMTGQKPKAGAHAISVTVSPTGEFGVVSWVDAAQARGVKVGASTPIKPAKPEGK